MTICDFWNQAFLASLTRLPVPQAKLEADQATDACILHWQEHYPDLVPVPMFRKDQEITLVYNPNLRDPQNQGWSLSSRRMPSIAAGSSKTKRAQSRSVHATSAHTRSLNPRSSKRPPKAR